MADEDDDLFDDDEDPDPAEAEAAAAKEAEAKAAADAKAKADADAAAAKAKADEGANELAVQALGALKESYAEAAKAEGFVAADFEGIGLKGVGPEAKAAFIAEAKASHDAKVAALAEQGFTFDPGAATDAARQAQLDAQDAASKEAWGATGPGQVASGDEKFKQTVEDEVKAGDTIGVIGSLLSKGGLGDFIARGKRG